MTLNKKPFIGILSFAAVLFAMPLGHALMIMIERILGETWKFPGAALLGFLGLVLLIVGSAKENETPATWYGFFAGIFLWTGWVEFSFVYFAQHLAIPPLMENGEIITKPEYLIMPSSAGLFLSTVAFFLVYGQTKCRFFKWLQRHFKLKIASAQISSKRNFAAITAMETMYIMWAFYIVLLIAYDKTILGDRHPVTYFIFIGSLIWSLYLFIRLIKFNKMAPAVRYAIPTVIIFWNSVEILARWKFFKEIWIEPQHYILEMILILLAFIGITVFSVLMPDKQAKKSE